MTHTQRATRRTLAVLLTLTWIQGAEVILTKAPAGALLALVEVPSALAAAAVITTLRRALR